jgi:hypothetical protein
MNFHSVERETPEPALVHTVPRHGSTLAHIILPQSGDVALADWDTLFVAVATRLRQGVATAPLSEMRGQVLQCVEALDQLRTTMLHEIDRAAECEAELRAALTQTESELATLRAAAARRFDDKVLCASEQ